MFPFAAEWICSGSKQSRGENKSQWGLWAPCDMSSGDVLVILCFALTVWKWLHANVAGKGFDVPPSSERLHFQGIAALTISVSWAAHHRSLLMQTVPAFFISRDTKTGAGHPLLGLSRRQERPPAASSDVLFMLNLLLSVWAGCPESWSAPLLLNYSPQRSAIHCIQAVTCSWMISWLSSNHRGL